MDEVCCYGWEDFQYHDSNCPAYVRSLDSLNSAIAEFDANR